jgi:antitoxin Phd
MIVLLGSKPGQRGQGDEGKSHRGEEMRVYTYSEARRKLASLLEQAVKEGEIKIKRRDGQTFVIRPETRAGSPLDVEGIDLGITTAEIVQFIQEGRRTYEPAAQTDSAAA